MLVHLLCFCVSTVPNTRRNKVRNTSRHRHFFKIKSKNLWLVTGKINRIPIYLLAYQFILTMSDSATEISADNETVEVELGRHPDAKSQNTDHNTAPEKTRKRRQKVKQICIRMLVILLLLFLSLAIFFLTGLDIEQRQVALAPSTDNLYKTSSVCASVSSANSSHFNTYNNAEEANADNAKIVHCGECGQCSTTQDIGILKRTRKTLNNDVTYCAKQALLTGYNRNKVSQCFEQKVVFTNPCQQCWVDNILCAVKKCKFSCMTTGLFNEEKTYNGKLNRCLEWWVTNWLMHSKMVCFW